MAAEKMYSLAMSGPAERVDEVIRRFIIDGPLHMEDAVTTLARIRRLDRLEEDDPCAGALTQADRLLHVLGLEAAYEPFEESDFTLDDTLEYLQRLEDKLHQMDLEQERLEQEVQKQLTDPMLLCLRNVNESMKDLNELRYVHIRVGRLPEKNWPDCLAEIAARTDEFVLELEREHGWVYILSLAVQSSIDRLEASLVRLGFERFRPAEGEAFSDSTAAGILARAEEQDRQCKARAEEIRQERASMGQTWGPELLRRRSWLKYESVCAQTKAKVGFRFGRFYMSAWIPAGQSDEFVRRFEAESGFSCVVASPEQVKHSKPPIRVSEKGPGAIMSPLVRMYGLPAYGTVDPKLFMVITYTLFFGMMFGDAGQGAVLAVLGFLLFKKTGAWLWRIIGVCGCSAVVFGLFYGSVFGMEDLLPWGGFHPLESEHIMPLLLAGAGVGVVVLVVCMAFNITNSLRLGDLQGALFSANGAAGMVLYVAVIAAIVCAYTGAADLLRAWYLIPFVGLPVLLMWIGEPLAKLLEGRPDWKPESWGMCVVEGFFDIFEAVISYMSNTMSFLRLGAFAISHAGMMMVVSMLCQNMAAVGTVAVMVLGNVFVAALEAALCSIQIIRLEFYEMFGRFYVSDGRAFTPVTVDYTS